jgi:hypothetical protein
LAHDGDNIHISQCTASLAVPTEKASFQHFSHFFGWLQEPFHETPGHKHFSLAAVGLIALNPVNRAFLPTETATSPVTRIDVISIRDQILIPIHEFPFGLVMTDASSSCYEISDFV